MSAKEWFKEKEKGLAVLATNVCPRCGNPGAFFAYETSHYRDKCALLPDGSIDEASRTRVEVDDDDGEVTVECAKCGYRLFGYRSSDEPGKIEFYVPSSLRR